MSRRAFRAAVVVAGATALTGLAACETILGLDATLSGDDGGTTGALDGSTSDGGAQDATTDAGLPAGSDGATGDAVAADPGRPWALDPTYGDGGVAILVLPVETVPLPGTLEIALVGTTVTVLAVGQSTADGGQQILVQYSAEAHGFGTTISRTLDGGDNQLLGTLRTTDGKATRTVIENSGREIYAYDPVSEVLTSAIANDSGAEIARVTITTSSGFAGPGLVDGSGVEATVGANSVSVQDIQATRGDILLAEAASRDGSDWHAGYQVGTEPQAAVLLLASGGSSVFATIKGASAGDDFAVTDFAQSDGGLFAVGYSGGSFAVWPALLDAGAPRSIPAGQRFTAAPPYRADYPYSFVRAAVADDGLIVASGAFGAPFLATFDAKGMPTPLLVPAVDGGVASLLDLSPMLPLASDGGAQLWLPGGLLTDDDDLYAAFASGPTNAQWVVVRLRRGTP